MVDVGCGIGGSSRHIARKYGCEAVRGITLSPKQAQRANDITAAEGLADTQPVVGPAPDGGVHQRSRLFGHAKAAVGQAGGHILGGDHFNKPVGHT